MRYIVSVVELMSHTEVETYDSGDKVITERVYKRMCDKYAGEAYRITMSELRIISERLCVAGTGNPTAPTMSFDDMPSVFDIDIDDKVLPWMTCIRLWLSTSIAARCIVRLHVIPMTLFGHYMTDYATYTPR